MSREEKAKPGVEEQQKSVWVDREIASFSGKEGWNTRRGRMCEGHTEVRMHSAVVGCFTHGIFTTEL